jgi:uracil phosphoribosyltransferase
MSTQNFLNSKMKEKSMKDKSAKTKKMMTGKLHVINHPLAQDKLWHLRNKTTQPDNFRRLAAEISKILAYEMARDYATKSTPVETPLAKTSGLKISESVALVPIMRAGQAMLEGMLDLLPFAAVGHIGIYRDKFVNNTVEYYFRLPKNVKGMRVAILDPLLATGDTAVAAITRLKEYEVGAIDFVSFLVAEKGLKKLQKHHPDVNIYTLNVESDISKEGYILPGIGDAGDRLYGTFNVDLNS